MERLSDTAIAIINELHTKRLDYGSEYLPLIEAAQRLAAYEDAEEAGRLLVLPGAEDMAGKVDAIKAYAGIISRAKQAAEAALKGGETE